jgi:hypothetical protein
MAMRAKTRLSILNPETGEIMDVDAIVYLYGKGKPTDRNFVKVFHAFLDDVLKDKEVMAGPFRLMAYIWTEKLDRDRLDFHLTAREAIVNLGITERTFYRWLSILLKKGYLRRISANYYVLRPYTAVIGKMANIDPFEGQD